MENLSNWQGCLPPQRKVLEGRYVRLEPLDPQRHGDDLYLVESGEGAELRLKYLWEVPTTRENFQEWLEKNYKLDDPIFYAVVDRSTGKAIGRQSFLRTDAAHGVTEIGHVLWGPQLAKTRGATEAFYLAAKHVFDDLGYRRFEWKCHNNNKNSRKAALRFGFVEEGIFRQHFVMKGENRDTAWFAIIDKDWPIVSRAVNNWLQPENFDENGIQKKGLKEFF